MVDAQDIDALLIGALYGELTPADEARLAVHLESHPTDRTALDDLTHARSVVRESRIFAVQHEPPQAISALLLQEAARRAPKKVAAVESERDGWFQRFVRSFMSHPAMAAAAMLVVVIGVAGTLYMKHDTQFADEAAPAGATAARQVQQEAPAAIAADDKVATGAVAAGSGSAYNADLVEAQGKTAQTDKMGKGDVARNDDDRDGVSDNNKKKQLYDQEEQSLEKSKAAHGRARDGLVVQAPPALVPKELPPSSEAKRPAPKLAFEETGKDRAKQEVAPAGAAAGGAPMDPTANATPGYATPPPPPPQHHAPVAAAPPTTPTTSAPRPVQPANTVAREHTDRPSSETTGNADATLVAWAKEQHVRVQALAKGGKCQDAAKLALDISTKAPDYYAQYVATDRALKACASYINSERDKEAEKSQKARAQKRVNANEPAPAQLDVK